MRREALAFAAVLALLACGGEGSSPPAAPAPGAEAPAPGGGEAPPDPGSGSPPPAGGDEVAAVDGAALFAARCALCHGSAGDGKGPTGMALEPPPRDFGEPAWQDSVSDEHIERVIAQGGPSVGLSGLMPAHPDLDADELAALRGHVRSFRR